MQAKKRKGSLFIVSAPSGAGKTTLCREIISSFPHMQFSVSYTTRPPRSGEKQDIDYTFVSREDFMKMSGRGEFAEWAEVHGEFYGTSKRRIEDLRNAGYDVILDIDVQGAQQIKEHLREGTYIFVLPPSLEILKKRLENRMSESEIQIDKRLSRALAEIRAYTTYDYVIINDVLEDSLREFQAIIVSQQLKAKKIDPQWIEERFFRQEEK